MERCYSGEIKKQTILLVHNYYQLPGGEDVVFRNEKKLLETHGHRVVVYTRSNNELNGYSKVRKLIAAAASVFNLKTYFDIKRIIRKERIDIVHVHNTLALISPSVFYAAIRSKTPIVQTLHNFRMLCPNGIFFRKGNICEECVTKGLQYAIKRKCYHNSRPQTVLLAFTIWLHRKTGIWRKVNFICLTEFNKGKLLKLNIKRSEKNKAPIIDSERVFVKPNFTYEPKIDLINISVLERYAIDKQSYFLYAGRLEKIKGIDFLINAWKRMGVDAPNLIVCGTGPLEKWCRDYVHVNKLSTVRFMGQVPHEKLLECMHDAKALIYPSRCYEGFPMTIIEAFSVGTPAVCSDLGNAGILVEEGITGEKYDEGNIYDFIRLIREMTAETKDKRRKMISDRYREKYTQREAYKNLIQIYEYRNVINNG